ncbi:MAG TPA: hypothetical protein VFE19_02565 [Jatrophihabitantaceae bacterium]|jgi:hypothetical protein|nr:hypothetical protein [Jatrophihabitantaceae bacterium]
MDRKTLVDLISVPIFTDVVGYVTTWTGVLVLFKPIRFYGVRVPGLRVLDKVANVAVDKGLLKLGNVSDFYRELEARSDRRASRDHRTGRDARRRREILRTENPQLWHDLPPLVREAVHARVRQQLPDLIKSITDEIGATSNRSTSA